MKNTHNIAFVTYNRNPFITGDDSLASDLLKESGVNVEATPWDCENINWKQFDKIILRSCWNYYSKHNEFTDWLNNVNHKPGSISNPINIIKWNLDKKYLLDLKSKGVNIPAFIILKRGTTVNLKDVFAKQGWKKVVIKPTISASGNNTWSSTIEKAEEGSDRINKILFDSDVIVQEYVEEVASRGEYSFIFFNKKFSHAVLKNSAPGDFRVQEQYGGSVKPVIPPCKLLIETTNILGLIDSDLLYARIDGVEIENTFVLMELELIEPVLFLNHSGKAAANFVDAILESCKNC